jgi:hypothetical protein
MVQGLLWSHSMWCCDRASKVEGEEIRYHFTFECLRHICYCPTSFHFDSIDSDTTTTSSQSHPSQRPPFLAQASTRYLPSTCPLSHKAHHVFDFSDIMYLPFHFMCQAHFCFSTKGAMCTSIKCCLLMPFYFWVCPRKPQPPAPSTIFLSPLPDPGPSRLPMHWLFLAHYHCVHSFTSLAAWPHKKAHNTLYADPCFWGCLIRFNMRPLISGIAS